MHRPRLRAGRLRRTVRRPVPTRLDRCARCLHRGLGSLRCRRFAYCGSCRRRRLREPAAQTIHAKGTVGAFGAHTPVGEGFLSSRPSASHQDNGWRYAFGAGRTLRYSVASLLTRTSASTRLCEQLSSHLSLPLEGKGDRSRKRSVCSGE